jgi:hypothetical protein
LDVHQYPVDQRPTEDQYQTFNVNLILDAINDSQNDVGKIIQLAYDLVKQRAQELGRQDWLANPWGRSAELYARRERHAVSRR